MYLGIDLGTSEVKVLLLASDGSVVGTAGTPFTVSRPKPRWSEQNPLDWWNGTRAALFALRDKYPQEFAQVRGIGLSGQMHGAVLLDSEDRVLRPAILWNDQRCGEQCDEIRARVGRERLIQITGNDALTGFTAPKILWVERHEPDVSRRARHILLPKDYVRYRLTGRFAMDKADGSGTMLFDLEKRNWSSEILDTLNIPAEWLPETFEGPEVTGDVTIDAAKATGLRAGTPVVAGGGDQSAGAIGVGAVRPGILALTLGTSGVVFAATESPLIEPQGRLHAFCHALPNRWHLMGVMLSAAGSLQWYRDALAPQLSFEGLLAEAAQIPAGSEGLLFLPYLSGERTPHPDPLARGAWVGLTVRHRRGHLTRAVLEGVAFGLKDCFSLMQSAGLGAIDQVRVSGGGAKSILWLQILADVLGAELVTVNTTEGAAYGAALLAGVTAGAWPDVESACTQTIKATARVWPEETSVGRYARMYRQYQGLYPALKDTSHALSEI